VNYNRVLLHHSFTFHQPLFLACHQIGARLGEVCGMQSLCCSPFPVLPILRTGSFDDAAA
jgi:hypothetical protein